MMKRETPGHSEGRISGNARVLWITERFPPSVGGMAVSCGRMVRGLRALDVHLDVLLLSGEPFREGIAATDRDGGVDYTLRAGGAPGHSAQLGWSLVRRRHAVTPYTFVVGFGANFPGFLAVSYASWLELPSLVLVRGNDLDRDWFEARRGHWVREALSRAGVVGAVSREMVERVLALFPEKDVRFLPNGVDVSEWELLPADRARREEIRKRLGENGRRVVGLFGELKFKKRVTLWLRALRDSGLSERVGLLVVGRIDEETRQILDDPVLVPLHLHVPFCERGDLAGLYAACDYVVIPSLFDGMPNALLEGMVSGALPIVSDAGGMKDVVVHGETGFLFRAEDGEAAARVTVEALSLTDEELSTIAARAKARVIRDFSTDRERARLLEILFPGENGRAGKRS